MMWPLTVSNSIMSAGISSMQGQYATCYTESRAFRRGFPLKKDYEE